MESKVASTRTAAPYNSAMGLINAVERAQPAMEYIRKLENMVVAYRQQERRFLWAQWWSALLLGIAVGGVTGASATWLLGLLR
jgi:hypothetical protein